jgi:hypothetical protein
MMKSYMFLVTEHTDRSRVWRSNGEPHRMPEPSLGVALGTDYSGLGFGFNQSFATTLGITIVICTITTQRYIIMAYNLRVRSTPGNISDILPFSSF